MPNRCPKCGEPLTNFNRGGELVFDCHYDPKDCRIIELQRESATFKATAQGLLNFQKQDRERIAELESLLRASEARERELEGKLDAAEAASEKDERDCLTVIDERDAREEVIGEAYQLVMDEWPEWSSDFGFKDALDAMNERLGADMRERESLKSERDAALAQVAVLRDDLRVQIGRSEGKNIIIHELEAKLSAEKSAHAAQQIRAEIEREAVEKALNEAEKELQEYAPGCNAYGGIINIVRLIYRRAAILDKKES